MMIECTHQGSRVEESLAQKFNQGECMDVSESPIDVREEKTRYT